MVVSPFEALSIPAQYFLHAEEVCLWTAAWDQYPEPYVAPSNRGTREQLADSRISMGAGQIGVMDSNFGQFVVPQTILLHEFTF